MSLSADASRINEIFAEGHRLVFWFDAAKEVEQEVDSLRVNGKLLKLTGSNAFFAKVLLEHEDPLSAYLVYAPFAQPGDEDNPLADTLRYAAIYFSDRISEVLKRKNLPAHAREYLEKYPLFWKNRQQRMEPFVQMELPEASQQGVDLAVLAVQCGSRVAHMDEILRRVLGEGMGKAADQLESFAAVGALDAFWQLCADIYGYQAREPGPDGLMATLLCTYTAHLEVSLPPHLQAYRSDKGTNVTVFLQQLMGHESTSAVYDAMSLEFAGRLNLKEALSGRRSAELMELDAFSFVDQIILARMCRALCEEEPERLIGGLPMEEAAAKRMQRGLHFAPAFEGQYRMILHAKQVLAAAGKPLPEGDAKQVVSAYTGGLYQVDFNYRKFCLLFGRLNDREPYRQLSDLVEKAYVNGWLDRLNKHFSERLTGEGRATLGLPVQEQFAGQRISPRAGRERTVVIISDALRFECGKELESLLNREARYDAKMEAMVAVLPSVTALGMAALLPHRQLRVKEGGDLSPQVDGRAGNGTVNREKILTSHYQNAVAMTTGDVMALASEEFAGIFNGKDVIYLYHDRIDAIGDDLPTQHGVFEACEAALCDIEAVIRKLTNEISATTYYVTADHGFQYRRSEVQAYEKLETRGTSPLFCGKRFRVTREPENMTGTISFPFPWLEGGGWLSVPVGAGIFKQQGGGQNYVHGGAGLCEILVPLLSVKSKTGRQQTRKAGLQLLTSKRSFNNLSDVLEVLQKEPVSDRVLPATYLLSVQTEDGRAVSAVSTVEANSAARASAERIHKVRITLQNRRYDPGARHYLVIREEGDALAEVQRVEFTIDIPFAGNLGLSDGR